MIAKDQKSIGTFMELLKIKFTEPDEAYMNRLKLKFNKDFEAMKSNQKYYTSLKEVAIGCEACCHFCGARCTNTV